MTIHVTQEDIDQGSRGSCQNCPVALAVKRQTKSRTVSVAYFIFWGEKGDRRAVFTPRPVHDFIVAYDERRKVKPFSFELPVEVTL